MINQSAIKEQRAVPKSSGHRAKAALSESPEMIKVINQLFLKFSAVYGYQWQKMYSETHYLEFVKKQWAGALQHFDAEIIEKAFVMCRDQAKYPPALSQFMEYCRIASTSLLLTTYRPPEIKKNFDVAKCYLKKIHQLLAR